MASRLFHRIQTLTREVVEIAGSFAPAGTGAPTAVRGHGFTVARTSAGLFTITFESKFPSYIHADAGLQLASGDDKFAQVGAVDLAARTMQVRIWDISGAAVADVSADANNRVNFTIKFRNTSLAR